MRLLFNIFVVLLLASRVVFSQTSDPLVDLFSELEQRILDGHKALDDFEVLANGTCSIDTLPDDKYSIRIWCLGSQIREDKIDRTGRRHIRCFTGSDYISWEDDEIPGELGLAIHRWPLSDRVNLVCQPANPRLFGLGHGHIQMITCHESSWDYVPLVTKDRNDFSVRTDSPGVLVGEWTNAHGAETKLTLGQTPKPHVIRFEATSRVGMAFIESTPQFLPGLEIGYPSKLVMHQVNADGVVFIHEEVELELKLNQQISNKTFSFAGMDIPQENIQEMKPTPYAELKFWDGDEEKVGRVETYVPPPVPTNWWRVATFTLCGVVVLLIACAFRVREENWD